MMLPLKLAVAAGVASALVGAQVASSPVGRARHHLAYDPATQRVLLLGGAQVVSAGGTRDSALWAWNGSTWRSSASILPQRQNEAAAFDSSRGRLVVHGGSSRDGELDDTWEFDGESWRMIGASGLGARAHHSMVFDAARKQVVLFGNSDSATANDTWGWDGRTWKLLASDGPPRRGVHAMAYDATRAVVVMFGGVGSAQGALTTRGSGTAGNGDKS